MNFSINAFVLVEVDDSTKACSWAVEFTPFVCAENASAQLWIISESKYSALLQTIASGDCLRLSRKRKLCLVDDPKGISLVATENTAKRSL